MREMIETDTRPKLLAVPMLDFSREFAEIREEVLAAIAAVCESQRFILGPEVARFEAAAAAGLWGSVCDWVCEWDRCALVGVGSIEDRGG